MNAPLAEREWDAAHQTELSTHIASGAMSGEQMFQMRAQLTVPLALDVDTLQAALEGLANELMVDISFDAAGSTGGYTYIAVHPDQSVPNHLLVLCTVGGAGGAASGATAGSAGAAPSVVGVGNALLSGVAAPALASTSLAPAGHAGVAGGTTGSGSALNLPTSGIFLTGGTGGGGLGNAGSTGNAGGAFGIVGNGAVFPQHSGGVTGGGSTANGGNGSNGFKVPGLFYFYGGTGGASGGGQGGSGGNGGAGGMGCGGGGGGGTLTGGTRSAGGRGGDGIVILTAF